jgi:hypothetical protein
MSDFQLLDTTHITYPIIPPINHFPYENSLSLSFKDLFNTQAMIDYTDVLRDWARAFASGHAHL